MKCTSRLCVSTLALASLLSTSSLAETPGVIRADFHKLIDRPIVPLDPVIKPMPYDDAGFRLSHLVITSEPGQPVPTLILQPADTSIRRPVVIVLHGTGGTKEGNLPMLKMLASAGFIAVAPDGRYHGERSNEGSGTKTYYAAIAQAYRDGKSHPWLYDTVFDVTRLIDYLQTRPEVDAKRIGLMGFSKGGMETWLTAAIDSRVAAAVPCIAVQDFKWGLDHDLWHHRIGTVQGAFDTAAKESHANPADPKFVQQFYDRVVPGIDSEFDCPAMLPLICPRPLLVVNGEEDPINPLPGAEIAKASAEKAYAAEGASDKFEFIVETKVKHAVPLAYEKRIVAWFEKTLGK